MGVAKIGGKDAELFEQLGDLPAETIAPFFLRKAVILNGTHTAMVGKFLGQFETVQQLLENKVAARWIRDLMYEEIVPTLAYRLELVAPFADETYDRYRNPYTNHKLADIAKGHAGQGKKAPEPTAKKCYERLFGKRQRESSRRCSNNHTGDRKSPVSRTAGDLRPPAHQVGDFDHDPIRSHRQSGRRGARRAVHLLGQHSQCVP